MKPIPKRLKHEPLIEAIWQVQFDSLEASEVLPGLLYARLRQTYPDLRLHRLPTADLPAGLAQVDPNLGLAAKIRLEAPDAPFLWQVGARVATVNCRKPYAGWPRFNAAILDLIQTLENSGVVPQPQRHSLRYIDLLTLDEPPDLSAFQMTLQLGGQPIRNLPLQMRLELPDEGCSHRIQIATPAQVQLPEGTRTGSVIDLETFASGLVAGWEQVRSQLDMLHDRSKEIFFERVLTPDALQTLEPEY